MYLIHKFVFSAFFLDFKTVSPVNGFVTATRFFDTKKYGFCSVLMQSSTFYLDVVMILEMVQQVFLFIETIIFTKAKLFTL